MTPALEKALIELGHVRKNLLRDIETEYDAASQGVNAVAGKTFDDDLAAFQEAAVNVRAAFAEDHERRKS